ncbi:MAG: hypothetical protein ACKVOX_01235 [Rhizobacter sp.]
MQFNERVDGEYRIYAGALDAPRGDGYIAAVVVSRMLGAGVKAREVFRDEGLACGHRWRTADEALMFSMCKAREWIVTDRQRVSNLSADLSALRAVQL